MHMIRFLPLLLCTVLAGTAAAQSVGTEDPAWSIPSSAGTNTGWSSVATQPDGKVLVRGGRAFGAGPFSVARYRTDGTLDTAFGSGGSVTIDYSGGYYGFLVDALGRIYVPSHYSIPGTSSGFSLARLLPDGRLDTSFGGDGYVRIQEDPYDGTALSRVSKLMSFRQLVTLQPDGKLLISGYGGESGRTMFIVVRLHSDGSLDTSFGDAGIALLYPEVSAMAGELVVAEDGSLLMLGTSAELIQDRRAYIFKLTPQGRLDTSFGNGGRVLIGNGAYVALVDDLLIQDGKLLVSGRGNPHGRWPGANVMVLRLDMNGNLDPGFGNGGTTFLNLGYDNGESGWQMALEPSGKILILASSAVDKWESSHTYLLRLTANGIEDSAFPRAQVPATSLAAGDGAYVTVSRGSGEQAYTELHKYVIDPRPRTGSLSTAQTPSVSGFAVTAHNMSGVAVDTARLVHPLGLNGYILTQSTDVDTDADIFVVVASPRGWYMRNTHGNFVPWDTRVSTLVPAYDGVPLTASVHVPVYAGQLPFAGTYRVYVGYMREGGPLIYIDEPMAIEARP